MKTLKLKDNTQYTVTDTSVIFDCVIELENRNDVVSIWNKMTDDNVSSMTLDDELYEGYTFASFSVVGEHMHLYFSAPLTTREQEMQAQIDALTAENAVLQDGAMAYDIITGGAE